MRRTSGEDLVRRRSSSELPPPFSCEGTGWVEADWWELGVGGGADSLRGGAPAAGDDVLATGADAPADPAATGAGALDPTAAFTSVSSRATRVCTGTVWPSVTRIS